MIVVFILLSTLATITVARPNGVPPKNVVTVPPNCPVGQQWINGQCRDIWRQGDLSPSNVVSVPDNCPEGQQLINGQCRDVWFKTQNDLQAILMVPNYSMSSANEKLTREADGSKNDNDDTLEAEDRIRNIISVPNQCPDGFKPDSLGTCREIFGMI